MGNGRAFSSIEDTNVATRTNTAWKDFMSLIKIGIVNSNLNYHIYGFMVGIYFHWDTFSPVDRYSYLHYARLVTYYCGFMCIE